MAIIYKLSTAARRVNKKIESPPPIGDTSSRLNSVTSVGSLV